MQHEIKSLELSFAYVEKAIRQLYLSNVVTPVIRERYTLSAAELAEIAALRERIDTVSDRVFDFMYRNIRVREQNRAAMPRYTYKIVSLGLDCFSRTIPTRWGLKPPKSLGEHSHPFDLAIHTYEALCAVIESDFAGYLDPRHLGLDEKGRVVHRGLNILFNHETGERYAENDFALFVETYRRRIDNFHRYVQDNPCLFVLHRKQNQIPDRLHQALCRLSPRADWRLLVINTSSRAFGPEDQQAAPERIVLAHIPEPYPGYVWHEPAHFTTPEGERFDHQVMRVVRDTIVEHFPLESAQAPTAIGQPAAA